jgi:hypothetical protein
MISADFRRGRLPFPLSGAGMNRCAGTRYLIRASPMSMTTDRRQRRYFTGTDSHLSMILYC